MLTPPPLEDAPSSSPPPMDAFSSSGKQFSPPPMDAFSSDKQFSPPPMDTFSSDKQFSPPPMDAFSSDKQFSPPPMDGFSSDKQFSPPPLLDDDFSPTKEEFSPPPGGGVGLGPGPTSFSPPPLDDFSPCKEVPPLQFSPPSFGEASPTKENSKFGNEIYDDTFEESLEIEDSKIKFDQILQMKPREIIELKEESEKCTNFMSSLNNQQNESASSCAESVQTCPKSTEESEQTGPLRASGVDAEQLDVGKLVKDAFEEDLTPQPSDVENTVIVQQSSDQTDPVQSDNDYTKGVTNIGDQASKDGEQETVSENASEVITSTNAFIPDPDFSNANAFQSGEPIGKGGDEIKPAEAKDVEIGETVVDKTGSDPDNDEFETEESSNDRVQSPVSGDVNSLNFENDDQEDVKDGLDEDKAAVVEEDDKQVQIESVQQENKCGSFDEKASSGQAAAVEEDDSWGNFEETATAAVQQDDSWGNFEDTATAVVQQDDSWGNFEDKATAAVQQDDSWGNFEDTDAKQADNDIDDDDFGDFDDFESATVTSSADGDDGVSKPYQILEDLLRKVDASLEQLVQTVFVSDPGEEQEQEDQREHQHLQQIVFQDKEVWEVVEDPASAPALEFTWPESNIYSILLNTLNIDRNVVLDGESWRRSIPRNNKSGNTHVEPTGGILQPTPVLMPSKPASTSLDQPSTAAADDSLQPSSSNQDNLPAKTADDTRSSFPAKAVDPGSRDTPVAADAVNIREASERRDAAVASSKGDCDASTVSVTSAVPSAVRSEERREKPAKSNSHAEGGTSIGENNIGQDVGQAQDSGMILPISGQVDLHSPDFDWSLPDPVQNSDPVNFSSSSASVGLKNGDVKKSVTEEARKAIDAFPLLNFMQSPVLIIPSRSPNPVRRLKNRGDSARS